MSDMGFTPNLIAADTCLPFRFCYVNGAFQGSTASASGAAGGQKTPVGVTDGSSYQFDKADHAVAGGPITLQPSNTVQVTAGEAITAGSFLMADATGRAAVLANLGSGTLAVSCYIALEAAGAAGDVIRAYRFGTRYLTGS